MNYVNLTPDYTGQNPDYRVVNEMHDFGANLTRRAIMPRRGAFFNDSVQLQEVSSGRLLVKDVDFEFAESEIDATKASGKAVSCYIIITNNAVTNPIQLAQYQYVGGYFSLMPELLADVTALLTDESNPVAYKDIVGKPEEGFTPEFHEHGEDNTFNWQYVVSNLERLRYALTVKHDAMHELLNARIGQARTSIQVDITPMSNLLEDHVVNFNDPHQITAAQANVYDTATIDTMLAGRLALNGTAVDSALFGTKNLATLTADAKYLVPVPNFVSGVFAPERLGPDALAGGERVLTTSGWKPVSEVANPINGVIWMGVNTRSGVMASLAGAPVGTKASYLVYYSSGYSCYGNGCETRYAYYREVIRKTDEANNWEVVGG